MKTLQKCFFKGHVDLLFSASFSKFKFSICFRGDTQTAIEANVSTASYTFKEAFSTLFIDYFPPCITNHKHIIPFSPFKNVFMERYAVRSYISCAPLINESMMMKTEDGCHLKIER